MKLCLLMVLLLLLHAQLKYGGLPEAVPRHGHEDNSPTGLPEAVPRHGHEDNSPTGLPEAVPRHGHEDNSPTSLPEAVPRHGHEDNSPTSLPEAVSRHGHKDNSSTSLPEAVPRHGHKDNSSTGLPEVVLEAGQQEVRPEGYVLELEEAGQQEVRPEGYVVALAFGEQLESGMHDLTQLSDLAHSWRLQVVEPYIQDSHFTLPTLPSRAGHLLKFSEVYDIRDFNTNLRHSLNVRYSIMVPVKQVANNTKHGVYVIVLQLSHCNNVHAAMLKEMLKRLMSHLTCGADNVISTHMCINTREKQNYRNLLHNHPNISQACQQARLAGLKLIVLIPHWNGIRTYKDKFFYWDPNFSPHRYIYDHGTRHSDQIRNATYSFSTWNNPPLAYTSG